MVEPRWPQNMVIPGLLVPKALAGGSGLPLAATQLAAGTSPSSPPAGGEAGGGALRMAPAAVAAYAKRANVPVTIMADLLQKTQDDTLTAPDMMAVMGVPPIYLPEALGGLAGWSHGSTMSGDLFVATSSGSHESAGAQGLADALFVRSNAQGEPRLSTGMPLNAFRETRILGSNLGAEPSARAARATRTFRRHNSLAAFSTAFLNSVNRVVIADYYPRKEVVLEVQVPGPGVNCGFLVVASLEETIPVTIYQSGTWQSATIVLGMVLEDGTYDAWLGEKQTWRVSLYWVCPDRVLLATTTVFVWALQPLTTVTHQHGDEAEGPLLAGASHVNGEILGALTAGTGAVMNRGAWWR